MAATIPTGAGLRAALDTRGWSYTRLIAEMRRVAAREGQALPKTESLIAMISRWLNDQNGRAGSTRRS